MKIWGRCVGVRNCQLSEGVRVMELFAEYGQVVLEPEESESYRETDYLNLRETANYLDFSEGTLKGFIYNNRYNLKPLKRDGAYYWSKFELDKFINRHYAASNWITGPVVGRKKAARYINKSAMTLKRMDNDPKVSVRPIKIGARVVRYSLKELDRYLIDQLSPY